MAKARARLGRVIHVTGTSRDFYLVAPADARWRIASRLRFKKDPESVDGLLVGDEKFRRIGDGIYRRGGEPRGPFALPVLSGTSGCREQNTVWELLHRAGRLTSREQGWQAFVEAKVRLVDGFGSQSWPEAQISSTTLGFREHFPPSAAGVASLMSIPGFLITQVDDTFLAVNVKESPAQNNIEEASWLI